MINRYRIEYNEEGEAYFIMDGHNYLLSEHFYDGKNLYLDYQAYNVKIEYDIDDYIILEEVSQ